MSQKCSCSTGYTLSGSKCLGSTITESATCYGSECLCSSGWTLKPGTKTCTRQLTINPNKISIPSTKTQTDYVFNSSSRTFTAIYSYSCPVNYTLSSVDPNKCIPNSC